MNTAAILRGPAIIKWRGATIYHRESLAIPIESTTFDVEAEPFGVVETRIASRSLPIQVTPSGRTLEVEKLLGRYATATHGDLVNIEEFPVSVDASTDILTTTANHLLETGDEVMVHALVTMPGGVNRTTRYYARVATATTITLHSSAAGATNNTNKIDISSVGSGVILDVTRPLVITTYSGLRIKYYNVGLTKLPEVDLSAGRPMLGQVEFRAFLRNGQDPDVMTDAYYEIDTANVADTSFDPAHILTQTPKLTWARGAEWTGLYTRDGAKIGFDLKTQSLQSDAFGEDALGLIFAGLDLTVTAAPQGVTEGEAKAALGLHTTRRGQKPPGGQLDIITDHYTFRIADAVLRKIPLNFSTSEQRQGDFEWAAQRKFSAGVPDPLFAIITN